MKGVCPVVNSTAFRNRIQFQRIFESICIEMFSVFLKKKKQYSNSFRHFTINAKYSRNIFKTLHLPNAIYFYSFRKFQFNISN